MKTIRIDGDGAKLLEIALKNLEGKVGKVGWLKEQRYIDAPHAVVAQVAAQNEFGVPSKNIPARPFMRPTIAEKKGQWEKLAQEGAVAIFKGKATIATVMEGLGAQAAGDIKEKIASIWSPPLSPYTIQKRLEKYKDKKTIGNLYKPLVETGFMLTSLTNSVEDENASTGQ